MKLEKTKPGIIVSVILILLVCFSACEKNKSVDPEPDGTTTTPTGTFMLHLHTYLDYNEVDAYNIVYTNSDGRKMSLSIAQLYISEIQLVKADNSLVDISGKKILKLLDVETYVAGEVPVGNYKSIRFKVGLSPSSNLLSPTATADSTILNRPEMWFGTSAQPDGYVFMNVQGSIDTTTDASGTNAQMRPFSYKIGTNANYKQVMMPDKNFTVVKDEIAFGHILIDYSRLFNGIALNQSANLAVTTAAENATVLAEVIVSNIPSMFIYE